jgi:hypothetical protein
MFEFLGRWCSGAPRVRQISEKERKHQYVPRLEILEDRSAAAVFDVCNMAEILQPPAGVVTLSTAPLGLQSLGPVPAASAGLPSIFDDWLAQVVPVSGPLAAQTETEKESVRLLRPPRSSFAQDDANAGATTNSRSPPRSPIHAARVMISPLRG